MEDSQENQEPENFNMEDSQENQEVPEFPDFDFSIEQVEEAVDATSNPGPNIMDFISYLETWKKTQDSIFQACEVLESSKNEKALFFAACVLDHNIPTLWRVINEEDRVKIRTFISEKIFSSDNLLLIGNLSRALAHVAVFDFPEKWEGYDTYLFVEEESNATFLMLEAFFIDVDSSKYITEQRRQRLKNSLIGNIDFFFTRIQCSLDNPDISANALNAFNAMVKWAPNSVIAPEFIEAIFNIFLIKEETNSVAVDCLKKIFLRRVDSDTLFRKYKYRLLELLSTVKLENNQSITNNAKVRRFVISLFYKFMMPIEKMVVESNDENMHQYFNFLIETILSFRETIPNKVWLMWYDIFRRIFDQKLNLMRYKYATELFMPMIQTIIQNLYSMLPFAVDEDGLLQIPALNCFANLVEIDYEEVRDFLEQQNPDPALSYALGCLMSVRAPKADMASFVQIVEVLFRESSDKIDEEDVGYIIALMFGFSRSASFLSTLGHFNRFLEIVIDCLQSSDSTMYSAATHALLYIAEKDPSLFFTEDTKIIINDLIQMSDQFIEYLQESSAKRIFQCLLLIIKQMDEQDKLQDLFAPVVTALSEANSENTIRTSLYIISKLAADKTQIKIIVQPDETNQDELGDRMPPETQTIYYYYGKDLLPIVIEPLFNLASNVIVQQNSNVDDVELLLNALSALIGCFDTFEEAEQPIKDVLALFFERNEVLTCFFTFISNVRSKFNDMNEMYNDIMDSFVYPFIPEDASEVPDDAPLCDILKLISKFEHANTDVEWVVKVGLGEGLESFDKDTNKAATKAVIRVFREMETVDLRELFNDIGVQIFQAIFKCLADSMHKPSSTALIKLFYKTCRLLVNGEEFPDELKDFIIQALELNFDNNEEDLFGMFLEYIVEAISNSFHAQNPNFKEFEEHFLDFLIMQNKYSPGDASEFKLYKRKKPFSHFGFKFL